jgi:STE24 endopeptidase
VRALKGLARENLSNLTPHPAYSAFYYSHPTLIERVAALEHGDAREAQVPAKG